MIEAAPENRIPTPETRRRRSPNVAVLIPCYNEELTIGDVVRDFRRELPEANIYVFDNNSADRTVEKARQAGAVIRFERRQGKGYVVQSMFRQVNADVYVMVDGDATYNPEEVHALISPVLRDEADMVVGSRLHGAAESEFKALNRFGNRLFLKILNYFFNTNITDMLSGYRAFNRRFVKSVPLFGGGFETETELTIKALQRGYRVLEVPARLISRPEGSFSKIRIAQDGVRILGMIFSLLRDYKPLTFFGGVGLLLIALAFIPGGIVIAEFLRTGLVPRLPSAVLAVGMVLSGMLLISIGLILHTIARRSQEFEFQLGALPEEISEQLRSEVASEPAEPVSR